MSAERKLGTAYEKIGTSAVKTRATGINDLRLLLLNKQNLTSLNDKGWHKMYEILFRAVVSEKGLYMKASKESVKSGIATRLQSVGYVFRLAVELGVEQLKIKTVKAVYNHILDTLPVPNGGLCEPISSDYTKALASCLGHAAHTEHLGIEEWQIIAESCCSYLSTQLELPSPDDDNRSEKNRERRNTLLVRGDSIASRRSNSDLNPVPKLSHTSEALLECLQHLVAVGNAPIIENAQMICDVLLGFLSSQLSITRVHQTVFATLNHILNSIVTNNIELAARISRVIVPVVTRLWETKLPGLKDEMIIFLILCQPQIRSEFRTTQDRPLRRLIEDLMETLCTEYIARMDRESLQLDDIELPSRRPPSPENRTVLRGRTIALRRSLHDFRAEQSWATLQLIATMVEILDRYVDSNRSARTTTEGSDGPLKRPRISTNFEDLMKRTRSKKDADRKLMSLQIFPFLADVGGIDEDDFASVLQDLYDSCSDSNPSISSWALISLTSCAFLKAASEPRHSDQWYQIWQLASRAATVQSTCRAACHLMTTILSQNLLSYTSVSKDVDLILRAIELNGPVSLVDSSLALWQAILNRRNTVPQSSRYRPGERLLEWFIAKWRPVEGLDRAGGTFYTHFKPHHVSSVDIVNFLSACAGLQPMTIPIDPYLYCGPVGQAYLKIGRDRELQDILFDTPDEELKRYDEWSIQTIPVSGSFSRVEGLEARIIDMLDQQLRLIRERWKQITSAQKQHVTDGILRNFISFLIISNIMCSKVADRNAVDKTLELSAVLNGSVLKDLLSYISHEDCGQKQIDGLLLAVSEIMPKASVMITSVDVLGAIFRQSTGIFICKLSESLNEKAAKAVASTTTASEDPMDIDDGFRGSKNDQDKQTIFAREVVQASCSADGFRSCTTASLMLSSLTLSGIEPMDVCGEFAAYLMRDVPVANLIMMRPVVHDFLFTACHILCDEDAANFCEYLAEELLQGYDMERCETSVGLCLDAVDSLCPRWVAADGLDERLTDCCIAVYEHAIKIGLEKKVTSYQNRTSIAGLIQHILKINREYRANHKQKPRTLLFEQLGDSDVRVMYHVAQKLPALFSQYSLAYHTKLCDEIEKFLPQTADWTEGLAMRIFTLAQLAMTNSSAVSRMVYRIFETGQLEQGEAYAARAMLVVAKSSQLTSQHDLYRLFSPKLVWAWTEHYELKDFPFRVFGYGTLKEMFQDVPDELVAQLLAKGKDDVAEYVAAVLGISLKELLVQSLAKTIAYGFACAIGSPPKQGGNTQLPVDIRVRKRLGDDQYTQLIDKNFRPIISNLFLLMVGDGSSQKFLSKDPSLAIVSHNMAEITSQGVSERRLNDPLKPFFKVKVILSAIDHMCNKVMGIPPTSIWTAPMVTFISRQLLDSLHPAHGPVHACTTIRNIRLLIALAGQTVCQGYPLEMLIHGLKRFVVDNTCSEDTVGILRYLLVKGQPYLSKHPTFALGIFLSLLSSLRDHVQASIGQPEPDTQIEQTSIAVAQQFHTWLASYLKDLQFTDDKRNEAQAFQAIVEAAVGFRQSGNALHNTNESELLRHLLDDDTKKDDRRLLDDVSRRLAFALCCSNFKRPSSFREDMFGTDDDSTERSKSLLRICKKFEVNDGFRLWSARVLGRSYAATGYLHDDWTQEMEFDHPTGFAPHNAHTTDIVPKAAILRRLRNLLLSEDSNIVGLAENTLEQIIYDELEIVGQIEDTTFSYVLTKDEYSALQWPQSRSEPDLKPGRAITACGNPGLTSMKIWINALVTSMCSYSSQDPIVHNLMPVLDKVDGLAEELFPYITHILLLQDQRNPTGQRREISEVFRDCLGTCTEKTVPHSTLLIKCILYLRTQETHEEFLRHGTSTKYSRELWLDIDYLDAAQAASTCRMFKTALLFAEIHCSVSKEEPVTPSELLLEIFRNVDDPDSYYGVDQVSSLSTVLKRFEYEGDGWKSLSLRGANLESHLRLGSQSAEDDLGVVDALYTLGMNGLSHSYLVNSDSGTASGDTAEKMFRSAWKLEQWDLPCPASTQSQSATIYKALRAVNTTADSRSVSVHVDPPFLEVMGKITAGTQTGHTLGDGMRTLAMLVEMEEVLVSNSPAQLNEAWNRLQNRTTWMQTGRYSDVEEIMAMRQATFGSLAKQEHLRRSTGTDPRTARFMEAQALVGCCKMARSHKVLQHALSAATQLGKVVGRCKEVELDITSVAALQAANVLWEEGQGIASIRMLQALAANPDDSSQSMVVGQAKLLAKLGNWVSEARLEKPENIMSNYLEKAILELKGDTRGSESGRVFHEFASFCDQQLNNPGNIEDYERALKLRQAKENEVKDLEKLMKANPNDRVAASHRAKAKTWLVLDDAEFRRLKDNREAFLEKSVLNYMKCLAACDDYDNDAVRFCALWLAHHDDDKVNEAAKNLRHVASRKFVPLMNQLSSRLLDTKDSFQVLLMKLITRICEDHPYHGIYQILTLTKTKTNPKDQTSVLRQNAAIRASDALRTSTKAGHVFNSIDISTQAYSRLAGAKFEKKRDNKPIPLRSLLSRDRYAKFEKAIPESGIPPPTMHIEPRADCDYSGLPGISGFSHEVSIASGISAPKIIKCQATDGKTFKMLVKGGNDDLRQDAIMEQVFEQVSVLLQKSRITRQRRLKVRTYKVIPLTTTSGVIEFVPNTIPLHDFLLPAHAAYFPRDWKHTYCRKVISDAQSKSRSIRIAEFQRVMQNFKPVMHFFFMHRFNGPDEWYSSRLAYTRSTAAISILGHVLGLGDRHGHNILLDEKTGEVVHIDLGVAFEQGRILPVPEVVPFRLTRDIVDGMGITKTEGVFRRCCEFTLEVLRNEAYNITTILDVLRYDPLYSWTISPVRVKRMQDTEQELSTAASTASVGKNPDEDDESEAARALAVVSKKLSKTLSVGATVNELIQQAGDERNLAVLYSGWAAYA